MQIEEDQKKQQTEAAQPFPSCSQLDYTSSARCCAPLLNIKVSLKQDLQFLSIRAMGMDVRRNTCNTGHAADSSKVRSFVRARGYTGWTFLHFQNQFKFTNTLTRTVRSRQGIRVGSFKIYELRDFPLKLPNHILNILENTIPRTRDNHKDTGMLGRKASDIPFVSKVLQLRLDELVSHLPTPGHRRRHPSECEPSKDRTVNS